MKGTDCTERCIAVRDFSDASGFAAAIRAAWGHHNESVSSVPFIREIRVLI
jgi:hypothetical protein